jgi:hypothetical protein
MNVITYGTPLRMKNYFTATYIHYTNDILSIIMRIKKRYQSIYQLTHNQAMIVHFGLH